MSHPLVRHARRDAYDVYVARPSKWGNPFRLGRDGDRATVIVLYLRWLLNTPWLVAALPALRDKRLACHCTPEPCHADVLAALANAASVPGACSPPDPTGGTSGGPNIYKSGQPREEP